MLSLMWETDRRGYLQHASGKPISPDQLARMTGGSADEVSRLLTELEDCGVFSRTPEGVVFSRRMTRDERKRRLCEAAGRLGGNPTLKGVVKGVVKGGVNPPAKGTANRNPTPSSSSSSSPVGLIHTHTAGAGDCVWPTPEAVAEYAASIHCGYVGFDLEAATYFLNHYLGKGKPLADWKATLANWKITDGGTWKGPGNRRSGGKFGKDNPFA